VWGAPERCDVEAMKVIARPFLPPRPPGAPSNPELWRPGALEELAGRAGLAPVDAFDAAWAYEYPDEATLGRTMLAPAGLGAVVGPAREEDLRSAIVDGLAHCRTAAGGYRLENEYRYLIARAI
jgi:hypothetical protein